MSHDLMPAVFLGHGSPLNALASNACTEAWKRIGQQVPRPAAVLSISAHWYVPSTRVTLDALPRTIHDFSGFPDELFRFRYPAPGDPALARRVARLLAPLDVGLDGEWGLDHGTWGVLTHLYPEADVPVVQLSIDGTRPPAFHHELGQRLAPLRTEGVLLVGSGNVVHNLRAYAWDGRTREPYDWAVRFENEVRQRALSGDIEALIDYRALGRDALLSCPTPEHYLPLLYVLGARQPGEPLHFPVEGIEGGSVSMLCVQTGG